VVEAWRDSPARFRADANVEEDLALTGYRDRVVVELAQNAADAATRAGVAGRLIFTLDGATLTATNTGTPLDAAGVESIAVARASAKVDQDGTIGRFGVGFAAVLAVSDEPNIASATGGVRWSRDEAVAAVADLPELVAELATRGARVPVLRLPFAADASTGDTVVTLPLRDATAIDAVRAQLVGLDPTLLLALDGLGEIVIRIDGAERSLRAERSADDVTLYDGATASRWHVTSDRGALPSELLANRPVEEQRFDTWTVTWAIPVDPDGRVSSLPDSVARVVRAPTAVDDPLTIPAVLIASYPLDSTRRRITTGDLADAVTAHAAGVFAQAVAELRPDPSVARLVPAGFPNGEIDGALHAAVLDRLAETAWLPVAADPDVRQRPREAVAVADGLVGVLQGALPSMLPVGWSGAELGALGVRRPTLADLVDDLGAVEAEPGWWAELYAALDEAVPAGPDRDALGALPVPLADGTMVTGPRGLALPDPDMPTADLSAIGVRLVHPDAAHDLLRSFGAVDGTPRDLLDQPQVRSAVEASYDEDDPAPIAEAVLTLLAATAVGVAELPWLGELALTDDGGDWRPAGELLLPGGAMASVVAADSAFGLVATDWVDRFGREAVIAAGVLDGPAVLRDNDAIGPTHDLDDEDGWWAALPADCAVEEFVAIRDLEQVRDDGLERLIADLAQPPLRAAVVEPALVSRPDGSRMRRPSYTAWWLSSRPVIGGRAPRDLRLSDADQLLAALYDEAPDAADHEFLRAIGVLASIEDADPDDVLARLADDSRVIGRARLRLLYAWLSTQRLRPPARVRATRAGEVEVVDAVDAVIVDAPDLLGLVGSHAVVPVAVPRARDLAARLDIPLASAAAEFRVVSTGERVTDATIHDGLQVVDIDGAESHVAWRYVDGMLHVDRSELAFGLGRGRAWRDGEWAQRHRRTEALVDPARGMMRDDEDDLDDEFGEL
jgi:hypothetical protein